jgi:DNA-binding PucR family transcriptional regulator
MEDSNKTLPPQRIGHSARQRRLREPRQFSLTSWRDVRRAWTSLLETIPAEDAEPPRIVIDVRTQSPDPGTLLSHVFHHPRDELRRTVTVSVTF